MTERRRLRGIVVLDPIGSEAEVSLRVSGFDIQLSGITEGIKRLPGREIEVIGRFLSFSRFLVEGYRVDSPEADAG
jgi:hypothetical protein